MRLRPTHRDENRRRRRPRESGDPYRVDSRSPAFAEDKFRGSDVTFDGASGLPGFIGPGGEVARRGGGGLLPDLEPRSHRHVGATHVVC